MINKTNYFIKNSKATIIIVHGISEHSKRYEELANKLNTEGFDVITYDQIGHGKSSGKRGKINSFHEHIDTLHQLVLDERRRKNNKLFLLGHSMGGGVVNMYEVKFGNVDGIISVAAATNTPKNMKIFRVIGFKLLRFLRVKTTIFKDDLANNPEVYEKTSKDPLMLKYMYLSLLGEMFIKGVKYLHKNIYNYNSPVLFIHGTNDKIVPFEFSKEMFEKVNSKDKEIKLYDGEKHELLNDYNKKSIINDIVSWLNNQTNK